MEIIAFAALVICLVASPIEDVTPLLGERTVAFWAGTLAVALWLVAFMGKRRNALRVDRASIALALLILVWGLISALWAQYQSDVITRAVCFANMLLFYIVYQDLVADMARLKWLMRAFVIACSIFSVWGLVNYFTMGYDRLVISDLQNPNRLANDFALALIMSFLPQKCSLPRRLFLILGQIVLTVGIFLSGSRGAMVALPLAVAAALALGKINITVKRKYLMLLVAGGVVGYTMLAWDMVPVSQVVRDRILGIAFIRTNEAGGRLGLVPVGVAMWKDYPILGVGWDNFPYRMGSYISETSFWRDFHHSVEDTVAAHNTYLSAGCELGVIGFGLLVLFLVVVFRKLMTVRHTSLGIMGMTVFFYICFEALKSDLLAEKIFWNAMGLVAVISRLAHDPD